MSIKVLVADDSITIQKVIGIIFGGDEYSLTVVDNGKAAVEKAREIIPDILLIDALMPGMSGYEVAESVRSTPSLAAKPILILTGSFEPFDEEKAKRCGADDYIAKPFESQQIITKVKELLELGSFRAEAVQPVPSPRPAAETIIAPPLDVPAPLPDISAPAQALQPDVSQPAEPVDIWSAFTPDIEQTIVSAATPVKAAPSAAAFEPDVFAIVAEEEDTRLVKSPETDNRFQQHTGSQWVPVEENTFEFEEESIAEPPRTPPAEHSAQDQSASFGDIVFEDAAERPAVEAFAPVSEEFVTTPAPEEVPAPAIADFADVTPAFDAPPSLSAPFKPLSDPAPASPLSSPVEPEPAAIPFATSTAAAVALTEEQLRAALTTASKEVIERIVWEIVPDLADAMIREAIRKIKEGV